MTLHFDAAEGTPGAAADAVEAFWQGIAAEMSNAQLMTVLGEVELIDEATGLLIDTTSGIDLPTAGTNANAPLPPATQGLARWVTGTVVNGRRLNGRNFIPGFTEGANVGSGVPEPSLVSGVTAQLNDLASGADHQLVVWHRPVDGAGGSKAAVTSGSMANYWALLGKRRPGF